MSSDRETRRRLEEVQQRLAGIQAEVELEESPGFGDEMRHLEGQLDLARGRGERAEERLAGLTREHDAAHKKVHELELAAQAKQANHLEDVPGAVTALALFAAGAAVAVLVKLNDLPLEVLAPVGMFSAAALGAVLRARVLRPKPQLPR